jgi:hypothetical protein
MAYTNFTPETRIAEAQDATAFKIWDESTWNGESALTTFCEVRIFHYAVDGTITEYDAYELITGADKTKFNEYLDIDGHTVEITDLTIDGVSAGERFTDGYYVIRVVYSEGSYAVDSEPYYDNVQAFLAKARCKARKLPTKLSWPLTDDVYEINRDIFLLRMYLDAAEDAADLGKQNEYRNFINLINNIFDYYAISECF